jgi:phosphoribosyl-ATP pyrophosphohydrolase
MARYLDNIITRFNRQTEKGINKYGQTLEDNPRTDPLIALEYLAEELTDGLMYIEEAKEKLQNRNGIFLPDINWKSYDWTIPGQVKKIGEEYSEVAEAVAMQDPDNIIREALDTMQTCWTLISMVKSEYDINIIDYLAEHGKKLERKGYLRKED